MRRISNTKLRTYLDGEADDVTAAEIALALENDPNLRATADQMRRSKEVLSKFLADAFRPSDEFRNKLRAMAEAPPDNSSPTAGNEEGSPASRPPIKAGKKVGFWGAFNAANTNYFKGFLAIAASVSLVIFVSEDIRHKTDMSEDTPPKTNAYEGAPKDLPAIKLRSANRREWHTEELDFGVIVPGETGTLRALLYRSIDGPSRNIKVKSYSSGDIITLNFSDKIEFYFEAKQNLKLALMLIVDDGENIPLIPDFDLLAGKTTNSIRILAEPPATTGKISLRVWSGAQAVINKSIPIMITKD